MGKRQQPKRAGARYRIRYTETVCWEVIVEAVDEEQAKAIVEAGDDDALGHRLSRWKHGDHQIESVELVGEE